jgi:hypothetical protein
MRRNITNKRTKNNKHRKTNKRGGVGSTEKKLLRAERLAESKKRIDDSLVNFNKSQDQSRTNINSMFKKIQLMDSDAEHDITDITPPKSDCPIEVYPDYETLAKEMKEIVTTDELEKYLLSYRWLSQFDHYLIRRSFETGMKIFMQMKPGEKIVWELCSANNPSKDGYNILLTNNGKILCLVNTNAYNINAFQTENHDFWIPPEYIDTIKILFKNMRNIIYQNETRTITNSVNFQAIYENLNEWLKHVKSTII